MKKILSLVLTLAAVAAVHAQGTFNSATYTGDPNGTHSSGVVEDYTAAGVGPTSHALVFGSGYRAQYYIGAAGISNPGNGFGNTVPSGMSAVGTAAGFLGSTATDAAGGAGYYDNGTVNTSFAGGSTVSLMLFAWKGTGTLAAATVSGHSAIYQFILGGAGSPAGPPTSWSQNLGGTPPVIEPTLANFGINTTAPEPATIALGLMGAGALFIRRRKV